MIYTHRRKNEVEEVQVDSIQEGNKKAIKDWVTGEHLPLHISDDSGHQVVGHSDLRTYLLDQTGLGKWEKNW